MQSFRFSLSVILLVAVGGVVWAQDTTPPQPAREFALVDPKGDNGDTMRLKFARSRDDGRGANDVTSYRIYRATEGNPFVQVDSFPATGSLEYLYLMTGLKKGVRYGYGVTASDGTNESTMVTLWRAPADTVVPRPPRNLKLTNPAGDDDTFMLANFDCSLDDSPTGDVIRYKFFRKRADREDFAYVAEIKAQQLASYFYRYRKLNVGVPYVFGVAAWDGQNLSEMVTASGDTRKPGPPRNLVVADAPNDEGTALDVSFNRSLDDGANANDVRFYRLYRKTAGNDFVQFGKIAATGAASYSYRITDLIENTEYQIGVAAYDGFQFSNKATAWATPLDNTPPGPAKRLAVADVPSDDGTALDLNWDASVDDTLASNETRRYQVWRATSANGAGTQAGEVVANQVPAYTFRSTGLTAGQTYWFWIIAKGPTGESQPTARQSGVPVDNRPVRPPLNLAGIDRPYDNGRVIDLTWSRSGDDGQGTNRVAKYFIYRRTANLPEAPVKIGERAANGAASYAWADTAVPMDLVLYEYTVTAVTSTGGESVPAGPARVSSYNNNVVLFQPPTNLTVADVAGDSGGQLLLTWNRSTSENDDPPPPPPPVVSSAEVGTQDNYGGTYEFYRRTASGTYTAEPTFTVSAAGTNDPMTYINGNLTNGTTYYYKVRYRRYNYISNFTAEASGVPVSNRATAAAAIDGGTGTAADGGAETVAGLSVQLLNPPATAPVGSDLILQASVSGAPAATVYLQYSVNGATAAQTSGVSGAGDFAATLKLKTAHLSPGTTIWIRAVAVAGKVTAATAPISLVVGKIQ